MIPMLYSTGAIETIKKRFKELRTLPKTLEAVKIIGESRNIFVRTTVSA